VVALIAAPEMPQWSIAALVILAGISFSVSVSCFDWYRAPIPIGTLPRALIMLACIWGGMFALYRRLGPQPQVAFLETTVYMDKPNYPMFANISFQNIGAKGKLAGYGFGAVTAASSKPSDVRQELQKMIKQLVAKGGGLTYSIGPQEKKWFTIFGPTLTPQQALQIKSGGADFYFAATFVTVPDGQESFDYCGFIVGNHPDAVLQCEE
jgi:hypothetical protein